MTNLIEIVLQIIRHFKFIEENKNSNKFVFQTSAGSLRSSPTAPKESYKNLEYIGKGLTTYYTNRC